MDSESRAAPGPAPEPSTFVRVRTTLPKQPFPPNETRQPIVTPRLVLRPLTEDDLGALHELRTQPEVMRWTALARPDRDLEETRAKLVPFLPPAGDAATYNWAICLRETGQMVGIGGCHIFRARFGWPEVGYMFRQESWGKGLATEFLAAWLRAWEGLEREEVELEVDERTVVGRGVVVAGEGDGDQARDGTRVVREQVIALTVDTNGRSRRVLGKAGFEWFVTWQEKDMREGVDDMVELPTYRYFPREEKGEE